jgi:hypothetical protein
MKPGASSLWRSTGDYAAFDNGQWEFQSRLYLNAARRLRTDYASLVEPSPFEAVACLVVGQFNMSLALELVCKSLYLKLAVGKPEAVYTHQVAKLLPPGLLSKDQGELLDFAAQCVEWSGRYPTPKWVGEWNKEKYDVLENGGPTLFDANDIPNHASLSKIDDMNMLYEHIHQAWAA